MTLYPHQTEGVEFLERTPRAGLFWAPGCGKTATTVRAAERIGASKVLVICPAVVRLVWRDEWKRWAEKPKFWNVTLPGKTLPVINPGSVVVVSYDRISLSSDLVELLSKQQWDAIILDEAHYLKNPGAKRTKAIYGKLVRAAHRVWILTGTPAPNHAGELWTHLRALWPDRIRTQPGGPPMSLLEFENRYCTVRELPLGSRRVRQITGTNMTRVDEVKGFLAGVTDRKRLKDVMQNMPPLTFTTTALECDLSASVDIPELSNMADDEVADYLAGNQAHFATVRRVLGEAKVKPAVEYLRNELDGGREKFVIFAHHKNVIGELSKMLHEYGVVVIAGDTPDKERAEAVRKFQGDEDTRIFIGQIRACGTGLTLHAARRVFFVESSFSPNDNFQAACRCHRIGQRHAVVASHFTVDGTIDDRVGSILARKERELAALID